MPPFILNKVQKVPLLPKLRGHFAEFLRNGSFDHLCRFLLLHQWRFPVRFYYLDFSSSLNFFQLFSNERRKNLSWIFQDTFPSTYPFGSFFILGAVLLYADSQCVENLEVSVIMYFTWFYVTHISIVTCEISLVFLRIKVYDTHNAPLPHRILHPISIASVSFLRLVTFLVDHG